VDGAVSEAGNIAEGQIFQAKGHFYNVSDLLGGDHDAAAAFAGGNFATLYLSPRDYHRIHIPADGTLAQMRYVPGRLFSVNPLTVRQVPNLFARNERVITMFDTALGRMAVVMVGAINVASIETVWHGVVTPPHRGRIDTWQYQDPTLRFRRGDEIGRFNMGSTVIVLFEPDRVSIDPAMHHGTAVQLGQALAHPK
jgi:phosphatidylserine decarboxylase